MDIDKVYLIDLPQWEDSTTGLRFEEEITYNTPGMEDTSFTWNQTWWDSSIDNSLSSHIDIDPEEWTQPFDEHTDWETYDNLLNEMIIQRMYEINYDLPEAREQALHQIQVTQEKQKEQYDRPIQSKPEFAI
ncbi:13666_t:CDS:2, partial [Gigaspora rosea]